MGGALLGGLLALGLGRAGRRGRGRAGGRAPGRAGRARYPGLRIAARPRARAARRRAASGCAGAVLAVKPDVAEGACRALGARRRDPGALHRGRRALPRLEAALGGEPAVVRAMPNTPALVGAGVTAISGGSFATSHDLAWAEDVLVRRGDGGPPARAPPRRGDRAVGLGPGVLLPGGRGADRGGVQMGLTREVSRTLVVETMRGSAALLDETGRDPEALRAEVTSPAGTTAAGIRALEARAVRSAFMEAVAAATERSRNLQR